MTQRVDLPRYFTDISTAGFNATSPAAGAIGYRDSATAARPNGAGSGRDDFGLPLRFPLMMTARASDGRTEAQMAATAVEAIDGSTAGLDFARREAAARGLRLGLHQADADALPFADESFDYVLSWNVIFHGTMGDVGRRLAEIWRVLKPGGLYQGTMLSKRDAQFGRGRPVAPDTFIRGSDPKAHPHYYCDLAGLAALFAGFELLSLTRRSSADPAPGTGTSSPNVGEQGWPC
jgi:SAM-dependent methyltransferase